MDLRQLLLSNGDYYAILGVQGLTRLVRQPDIRKAYRKDSIDSIIFTQWSPVKPGMAFMCFYAFLASAKTFGKEALKCHPDKAPPHDKALGWSG